MKDLNTMRYISESYTKVRGFVYFTDIQAGRHLKLFLQQVVEACTTEIPQISLQ